MRLPESINNEKKGEQAIGRTQPSKGEEAKDAEKKRRRGTSQRTA